MEHLVHSSDKRTNSTPTEWLKTCSQIGRQANEWSGRNDLVAYIGEGAGLGEVSALFIPALAEIEIDRAVAFGSATTPEMIGDFTQRSTHFEFPVATGTVLHEALHARLTFWDLPRLGGTLSKEVWQVFQWLEESRIEGQGAIHFPTNRQFLRASALALAFAEIKGQEETVSTVKLSAHLASLSLARVDAGILVLSDVKKIYDQILKVLGEDLYQALRKIWQQFQRITTPTQEPLAIALCEEWVRLVNEEAEKRGEPTGSPEGGQGEPSQEFMETLDELQKAMDEAQDTHTIQVMSDLDDQEQKEKSEEQAKKSKENAEKQNKNRETSRKVFMRSSGVGDSKTRSTLQEVRKPKSGERVAAIEVARMLERAKYRERSTTEIKSVLPQGRLNSRSALQASALKSRGSNQQVEMWRKKVRKQTDEPTLTIGVMVDISGSMSSAMEAMATTAWVISEAGRRIQAKTAMVYYGEDVFPTLKAGQHLPEVSVYSASDSTEEFGKAFSALDGSLDLLYGSGARLLVVVSDGAYRNGETEKAREAMLECHRNGVAVLWINPSNHSTHYPQMYLKNTNGSFLDGVSDPVKVATEIGKSASDSLTKVGLMNG
jgi:hypothetical protein